MDDHMSWVTSWEQWRRTMGPSGSRQRKNVLAFLETHPAILYWGDSWFSTPLYLNLARQSARRVNGLSMIIGKPGAQASTLFASGEVERIGDRVANNPFDLVCLSAGGNDCLSDRLAGVFRKWIDRPGQQKKIDAAEAYAFFRDSKALDRVTATYVRVLDRLQAIQRKRPHLRVIGHPYVPVDDVGVPAKLSTSNIGLIAWVKDDVGPWLWTPMKDVVRSKDEAKVFARLMLEDGFRDSVLVPLSRTYGGLFSLADFRGIDTGTPGFWNDEIHPGEQGFATLSGRFNAAVRDALPAHKRHAVSG